LIKLEKVNINKNTVILEKEWLFFSFRFGTKKRIKKAGGSCFFTHSNTYCCIIDGKEKEIFYGKL